MTKFVTPLICVSPYNWDLRYKIDTLSPNNKTCSPFITTGCFTPTCHRPEIEVSRLNWDSYSCFFFALDCSQATSNSHVANSVCRRQQ